MIKPKARKHDVYADAVQETQRETRDLVERTYAVTQTYRNIHTLRVFYETFPSHRLMHIGPWHAGEGDHFIHMTKLLALLYQDEITSKAIERGRLQVGIIHINQPYEISVLPRRNRKKGSRIAFRVYTRKHAQRGRGGL